MPAVRKSAIVAASPEALFRLVDAVEDYPQFLPWCRATEVLSRDEAHTHARIHVDYHGLRLQFATRNRKEPPAWMHLAFSEGPFDRFGGHWHFLPLGEEGCRAELTLDYAFSSRAAEAVAGPVLTHVAGVMVDAFVARALEVVKP